jgi:hypothetical protein
VSLAMMVLQVSSGPNQALQQTPPSMLFTRVTPFVAGLLSWCICISMTLNATQLQYYTHEGYVCLVRGVAEKEAAQYFEFSNPVVVV